jgi:hypothetical protein
LPLSECYFPDISSWAYLSICRKAVDPDKVSPACLADLAENPRQRAVLRGFAGPGGGHAICTLMVDTTEDTMTLTLTPSLTIRIRRAADNASRVIRTHTRRLSITSLSFMKMEVMVFKYHGK